MEHNLDIDDAQGKPGSAEYLGVARRSQSLTLLDLFAGAGGLSLGLTWAGFGSLAAVEVDPAAADTYDANFGGHILRDGWRRPLPIEQVDFTAFKGRVDLLSGGPPCQGFSLLGTRLDDDPRNRLWREFIRAVDEVQPRAFLMENVPPILKTREGAFTVEHARELGYSVVAGVLSAERFGVPQKRKRAFFLGVRGGVVSLLVTTRPTFALSSSRIRARAAPLSIFRLVIPPAFSIKEALSVRLTFTFPHVPARWRAADCRHAAGRDGH